MAEVRHLFAALNLGRDKLYGHIKPVKRRTEFLAFCRYLRTLYPTEARLAIVCDNFSPHLTTNRCRRVADWAEANNVEIAYTPTNSSWLNRIEAQFTWVPRTVSRHATCTYSCTRPPSRSRRSSRMVAPEGGAVQPAGGC